MTLVRIFRQLIIISEERFSTGARVNQAGKKKCTDPDWEFASRRDRRFIKWFGLSTSTQNLSHKYNLQRLKTFDQSELNSLFVSIQSVI